MAFTMFDGSQAVMKSAWWAAKTHKAPLGLRKKQYRDLIVSLAGFENDPCPETLYAVGSAIMDLRAAVDGGEESLPLMKTKAFRAKHQYFLLALNNLEYQRGRCDVRSLVAAQRTYEKVGRGETFEKGEDGGYDDAAGASWADRF